ncbi:MAG: VOC family protein [Saprospiraceae bacterium]|nr:VOC family protein [Saprospiraceae bacterium]
MNENLDFEINFLDHVALRVKDMETSAKWYHEVLGLKIIKVPEWGKFPVFLLAGQTGIALFPANPEEPKVPLRSKNVIIDHFAFNVDNDAFAKARKKYESLGIEYNFQDHIIFHSIYTKDPDGHVVELTTTISE